MEITVRYRYVASSLIGSWCHLKLGVGSNYASPCRNGLKWYLSQTNWQCTLTVCVDFANSKILLFFSYYAWSHHEILWHALPFHASARLLSADIMYSGCLLVCFVHPFLRYQTCEHSILTTDELILMQIATSGLWGNMRIEDTAVAELEIYLDYLGRHLVLILVY